MSMFGPLLALLLLGEFLNTPAEVHAFTHGVYMGFTSRAIVTPPEPENDDVLAEPHYYRGGYLLGTFLQLAVLAGMVYFGASEMGVRIV